MDNCGNKDWRTRRRLGQGLPKEGLALFPLNLCCSAGEVMYATYTAPESWL